jgi:hypothetical protein
MRISTCRLFVEHSHTKMDRAARRRKMKNDEKSYLLAEVEATSTMPESESTEIIDAMLRSINRECQRRRLCTALSFPANSWKRN